MSRTALLWSTADALESDGRVAVGGDSAGANLAITVAHEHRNHRRPAGLLAFYPPVDPLADTRSRRLFGTEFFLTNEAISAMATLYLGVAPPSEDPRAATPQDELHTMPPTYLVTAGFDPLRDEGEEFGHQLADSRRCCGVPPRTGSDARIRQLAGRRAPARGRPSPRRPADFAPCWPSAIHRRGRPADRRAAWSQTRAEPCFHSFHGMFQSPYPSVGSNEVEVPTTVTTSP